MNSIKGPGAMEKTIPIDATTKLVEVLQPLPSEDRIRAIRAAMILLGENQYGVPPFAANTEEDAKAGGDESGTFPPRARSWMKQNDISRGQLQHVFHIGDGGVDVIAAVPGKSKKEQTYNAYVLAGLGQLLLTGNATFHDKLARALCESSGCYDSANHSVHLRNRGNEFAGTKDKGWTLTAPGLRRAAELIRELSGDNRD
ncbi:MAG TPA: hypothetical protein VKP67_23635 [Xanthobacteraceae bacterium]|nr:hypothetical protein [Xanthobacteraceae bacterium]